MATLQELGQRALSCAFKRAKLKADLPPYKLMKLQKLAIEDEAVELLEATRKMSQHINYNEDEEEAADVIIATLSYLALTGVDIDRLIDDKMSYNEKREK